MAQLTITVPDSIATEALIAISSQRGYDNREDESQSRVAFVKQTIIDSLKRDYKMYKKFQSRAEEAQVESDADEFINVLS